MVNGPMGGFMGTPPAPAQPPQVNFTTTAESRGGFNNFLRSIPSTTAMTPIPPMGSSPMPPMGGNPMANIDIFNPPQNFLSGGLVQFGNDLMRSLAEPVNEKTRNIGPFLNVIEDSAQQRFGVDLSSLNNQNQNPFSPTGSIFQAPKAPGGIGGGMGISSNPSIMNDVDVPDSIFTPSVETDLTGGAQLAYMQMDPDGDGLDTFGKPMRESTSSGGMSLGDSKKLFNDAFTQGASGSSSSAFGGGDSRVAGQMAGMSSLASGIGGMPQMFYNGGEVDDSDFGGFSDYSSVDSPSDYSDFSGDNNYDDSDPDSDMDYTDSYSTTQDQEDDFSDASAIGQAVAAANAQSGKGRTNITNVGLRSNLAYSPQFAADVAQAQGLDPSVTMSPEDYSQTTQGQAAQAQMDDAMAIDQAMNQAPASTNIAAAYNPQAYGIGNIVDDPLGLGVVKGADTSPAPPGYEEEVGKPYSGYNIDAIEDYYNAPTTMTQLGLPPGMINSALSVVENLAKDQVATDLISGNYDAITDSQGNITGSRDEFGRVRSGMDFDAPDTSSNESENPLLLRKPIIKPTEEVVDKPPNVIGGGDADVGIPTPPQSVVVDSPFTSNVSKYTPIGFDGGDLNALLAALLKTSNPQSMAQGGVAGYAEGGLINAVDNFLASV